MVLIVSLAANITMQQHSYALWETAKRAQKQALLIRSKKLLLVMREISSTAVREVFFSDSEYNPKLTILLLFCSVLNKNAILSWHDVKPHPGSFIDKILYLLTRLNIYLARNVVIYSSNQMEHLPFSTKIKVKVACLPILPLLRSRLTYSDSKNNVIAILGNDAPYKALEKLGLIVAQKLRGASIIQYSTRPGYYSNLHRCSLSDEVLLGELSSCKYLFIGYREITQSQNIYWAAAAGTHAIVSKQVMASIDFQFEIVDKWTISVNNSSEEFWIISTSLDRVLALHDDIYNRFWKQL